MKVPTRYDLGDERGATTVTAALMIAALVGVVTTALAAGSHLVAARQAAVAADLAAIAGATAAQQGQAPCPSAQEIAAANHARLLQCQREGEDVQVSVEKRERRATARAGPAD